MADGRRRDTNLLLLLFTTEYFGKSESVHEMTLFSDNTPFH